jgi:glutamate synthase (NADPH/NADH) large chain
MTGGVVVVLGPTGRNFAAGMSGGTAFVLGLDAAKVNPELVDLTPLTDQEQEILHELVARHADETDSAVAKRLLKDWQSAVEEFTAVVPRDYKRVMELIRTAEAAGRNVDEAVMGVKRA